MSSAGRVTSRERSARPAGRGQAAPHLGATYPPAGPASARQMQTRTMIYVNLSLLPALLPAARKSPQYTADQAQPHGLKCSFRLGSSLLEKGMQHSPGELPTSSSDLCMSWGLVISPASKQLQMGSARECCIGSYGKFWTQGSCYSFCQT